MSSNAERAERGRTALAAYRQARGEIDVLSSDATDLITDVLHYLRTQGGSTTQTLASAEMHYNEERHGTYGDD